MHVASVILIVFVFARFDVWMMFVFAFLSAALQAVLYVIAFRHRAKQPMIRNVGYGVARESDGE